MQQQIAVYGGTFDPIHKGHLRVAEAILDAFAMDRLLFVPAFVPPHKRHQEISSQFHRWAMLTLATADRARMFVSSVELESPERPYTVETLSRLQAELKDSRLFFVMGVDSFRDVTMWHEHGRLLTEYDVIVATRPGYESDDRIASHLTPNLQALCVDLRNGKSPTSGDLASKHIYLTDYVEMDISATKIREAAQQNQPIDQFVEPEVAAYIEKYQIYRKN